TATIRLKSDILFDTAEHLIDAQDSKGVRSKLAQLATLLGILYKDAKFQFIGHTDTRDTDAYNQWLSEQRAIEVARIIFTEQLQSMEGAEPNYAKYSHIVEIANELLYKRKSARDRKGFPEWQPQLGGPRAGGNLERDKAAQEARKKLVLELEDLIVGK